MNACLSRLRTASSMVVVAAMLALGAAALSTTSAAATTTATTTATTVAPSAAHPFGDPTWFPLRQAADVGCAKTACGAYTAHGYWALDLVGHLGDPVHAAGAGILHVGGRASGCAPAGGGERDGNWVWVDHGAGVVSRYHHLDTITAKDGQLVTPATQIGTMGSTGDNAPCTINYLHFEVRHGGVKGTRVDPGQLSVCSLTGLTALPAAFGGSTSWDDPAVHPRPRLKTLVGTDDCIDPSWLSTATRPAVTLTRQSGALLASWARSAAGSRTVLAVETYRPSLKAWGGPQYLTAAAGATSYRLTGLENGRPYRVSISTRTGAGPSLASATQQMIPAGVPSAPPSLRYASWTKRDYIHYGWNRPVANGSTVTTFTTAWRCAAKSKPLPAAWSTHRQPATDTYLNIRKLTRYDGCQVKVRAANAVGDGAWSATTTVHWGDR